MFGTRTRPGRRAALALTLSVLLHAGLAVGLWVYELIGGSGFELPRREYAVEIVGVSEEEKPAAAPEAKAEEKKPAEPDKPAAREKGPKEKQAAPPRAKAAKPPAPKVAPPPPAPDDAPVVAKDSKPAEDKPAEDKPAAEDAPDKPAIPWPLDEPEARAATSVDLPGSAPGDAALLIAFRLDRLRGTPWATAVERILAPMPDYETIIAGGTTPLAELFDLLFIATPDVRDVTATFLAAHHHRDEAELEQALAGKGAKPRVTWAPAVGGTVGERAKGGGVLREDPRVFLVPEPGWIVLARPEHLPGMLDPVPVVAAVDAGAPAAAPPPSPPAPKERPRWMKRMVALVGDPTAADAPKNGPIAIFAIARLPRRLVVPGVGVMPAPQATVISVFADAGGLRVVGALDFVDDNAATAFAAAADRTRDAAMGSLITRHFINQVNGGHAVSAMRFQARGKQVAVTTDVPAADAAVMIDAAVAWTTEWFNRHQGGGE